MAVGHLIMGTGACGCRKYGKMLVCESDGGRIFGLIVGIKQELRDDTCLWGLQSAVLLHSYFY